MSATCSLICSRRSAGRCGQGRDLVECARKLSSRFDQRGALQRPLSGFAPKARGLLDQPSFGAVTRQNLRLVLSDVSEVAFEGFGDASVQRTSRLAQKGAVSRILDQRVFKEITRMRRYALTEQQASPNDPIQSWSQLLLGLAHYSGQQSVSELASYRRSDLRDLFGGAKPVEPRH